MTKALFRKFCLNKLMNLLSKCHTHIKIELMGVA